MEIGRKPFFHVQKDCEIFNNLRRGLSGRAPETPGYFGIFENENHIARSCFYSDFYLASARYQSRRAEFQISHLYGAFSKALSIAKVHKDFPEFCALCTIAD